METILANIRGRSVLPAITVAAAMHVHVQQAQVVLDRYSNESSIEVTSLNGASASDQVEEMPSVSVHVMPTQWTKQMERRFDRLCRAEALSTISEDETRELNQLSQYRRNLVFPRDPEEILRDLKEKQLTKDLVAALSAYVEFKSADQKG